MAKLTRDEKIFRLGKIITDRKEILLGLEKMSPEAPEYWGIDCGIQYAERRYGSCSDTLYEAMLLLNENCYRRFLSRVKT